MKTFRLIAACLLLAVTTVSSAYAQQRGATQTPARPATAAPADNGPVPAATIALVDVEALADDQHGITKLVNAMKRVDAEFATRRQELQALQTKVTNLQDEIKKTATIASPATIQQKQDQLEQMQRELQFKAQGAQADYQRRMTEIVGPIYDDIGKALENFARAHNITMILDSSKLAPAILTATGAMNVTAAFVQEYNRANPATATSSVP